MTPKERYEARKAERKKRADDMHINYMARKAAEEADMLDTLDRFVTAVERIADALERPQVQGSALVFDPNSASGFRVNPNIANTHGA